MNTIVAPGDFNGDGKADLVARDAAGNLFLYRGDGGRQRSLAGQIGTAGTP